MEQTYTQTNLIKYLYSESDIFEMFEIEDALNQDDNLRDEWNVLLTIHSSLNEALIAPPPNCCLGILAYSRLVN